MRAVICLRLERACGIDQIAVFPGNEFGYALGNYKNRGWRGRVEI